MTMTMTKPTKQDVIRFASDPAAFRGGLYVDTDNQAGGPMPLGAICDPWQEQDFHALDPAWRQLAHRTGGGNVGGNSVVRRGWLERPRGHSKTCDIAVMVSWALFASPRCLSGIVAAADRDQAALLRDAIAKLLILNPWLAQVLDVQNVRVRQKRTGSTLDILSSDAGTSYGILPDFIVADEVCHWSNDDLWDSLFSAAGKREHCLLVCITNAGHQQSWQFKLRESVRSDPLWYFHRLDGPRASWITEERLQEQERHLPKPVYRRLWLNEWSKGGGDALDEKDIKRSIKLDGPVEKPERGWMYVAGLDLGLANDATALAVVGRHVGWTERIVHEHEPTQFEKVMYDLEDGELGWSEPDPDEEIINHAGTGATILAGLFVWRPQTRGRVSLAEVEKRILEVDERLKLSSLGFDPWQAGYLSERLNKAGVPVEQVDQQPKNLKQQAECVLTAFGEGELKIYSDDDLLQDLRSLILIEKSYGVRLEAPRSKSRGHADSVTALSIALLMLRRCQARRETLHVSGELVSYPWLFERGETP